MRLHKISVENFRCFASFQIELGGDSLYLIGENGSGKSALLSALARSLGAQEPFLESDFLDETKPILIVATLGDLTPADQALFSDWIRFDVKPPLLEVGVRAEIDGASDVLDVVFGSPRNGWKKRATREQRSAMAPLWLAASREPMKELHFGNSRTLFSELLRRLSVDKALALAMTEAAKVGEQVGNEPAVGKKLASAATDLGLVIPGVSPNAFTISSEVSSQRQVLRQLKLLLEHHGTRAPIDLHSDGLQQLALFAVALQILETSSVPIVLVDEPELSLHPHAQRSLVAMLRKRAQQCLVATHSSNVLDRVDPRSIARLVNDATGARALRPTVLTEWDAERLSRRADPTTTEAFFARCCALVEGLSDRLALLALAKRINRDLDAEGVSIVSLNGGGELGAFYDLLGPKGVDRKLVGLCDKDKEGDWIAALNARGHALKDAAGLEAAGYFVAQPDIEYELMNALGAGIEAVLKGEKLWGRYQVLAQQPTKKGVAPSKLLHDFIHDHNTTVVPAMVDAIDLGSMPRVLTEVLSRVKP